MKYRKKPVVIEAWEFTRDSLKDVDSWVRRYRNDITLVSQYSGEVLYIEVETLEGTMRAELGDYIIKGVQGEFYPCKPDIFEATYDVVKEGVSMGVPLEVGEYIDQEVLPELADGHNTADTIYEHILDTLYRDMLDDTPEHPSTCADLESEKLVSDYWMAPKNKQAIIDYIEDAWKDWGN